MSHNPNRSITIKKQPRFFDSYADIANTKRKTLVLPNRDINLDFQWCLGNLKSVKGSSDSSVHDREPVTITDPGDLQELGIEINSKILTLNGVDTSVLTESQVRELMRQRPLTMRFAIRKRDRDGRLVQGNRNNRMRGGNSNFQQNQYQQQTSTNSNIELKSKKAVDLEQLIDPERKNQSGQNQQSSTASAPTGQEMKLQHRLKDNSWAKFMGLKNEKDGKIPDLDAEKDARKRRFQQDAEIARKPKGPQYNQAHDKNDSVNMNFNLGGNPLKVQKIEENKQNITSNINTVVQTESDNLESQIKSQIVSDSNHNVTTTATKFNSNTGPVLNSISQPPPMADPAILNNLKNDANLDVDMDDSDDDDDDEEEIVTVGPVVGKSLALEKSYLRLTADAKAEDVRSLPVLKLAFERLKNSDDDVTIKNRSWNWLSDQLRAIRQDMQVQNIENAFTAEVYAANGLWALQYTDLGQFHQCAMQLKGLQTKKPEIFNGKKESDKKLFGIAKEFTLLRGMYNVFMGLEHVKEDRLEVVEEDIEDLELVQDGQNQMKNDTSTITPRLSGPFQLANAFRRKEFSTYFRLRRQCSGPLGDLCSAFDNMFRCQALLRLLSAFKVEAPNYEVLAWLLGDVWNYDTTNSNQDSDSMADSESDEEKLRKFLINTALIKDLDKIKKAPELQQKIKDSVAMNVKHAMKA